jgi:2-iminoacetate synthase
MHEIINEELIQEALASNSNPSGLEIDNALDKAMKLNGLELQDVAVLLNIGTKEQQEKLFKAANYIKDMIYGNRLVLFAPLYISNYCSNNCLYCGFRAANKEVNRIALGKDEIIEETLNILRQGHKRALMLMGEHHSNCSLEDFVDAIRTVYAVKNEKGSSIRRINVEIAPLEDKEFELLKQVEIGTYTVFQETYHRKTYKTMHPTGKKADYDWRLESMDRALSNKMNDVGIGALFGLYDHKFEVMALLQHANHLDSKFGVGPHTISIPRIRPAKNAPASENIPYPVDDKEFKKIVAILRCAVPYTGIILSTREPASLRTELFNLGVSQISAGSKTSPGGYKQAMLNEFDSAQFDLNDSRSSGEIIKDVIIQGFVPSFCTGCYRVGRVGADFMDLAKPGLIKMHCLPNALTTLREYLNDYADAETQQLGADLIERQLLEIPQESRRQKTIEFIERIDQGERDLYF